MAAGFDSFRIPLHHHERLYLRLPRPPEPPRLRKGLQSGDGSGSDRLGAFGLCRWAVVAVERASHRVPGPEFGYFYELLLNSGRA